ncbi:hypothetical protein ARMGADRAFT_1037883 [Armillaria gallica]|uniref:Uncharacterized protein n=1 Tax=Armillaria gallica TaxID=47427 RepID=A0A2H3CKF8_ARMGA|nr:hypothetical protein ARMGADRAFT_1037883 [Armillaria gallica]
MSVDYSGSHLCSHASLAKEYSGLASEFLAVPGSEWTETFLDSKHKPNLFLKCWLLRNSLSNIELQFVKVARIGVRITYALGRGGSLRREFSDHERAPEAAGAERRPMYLEEPQQNIKLNHHVTHITIYSLLNDSESVIRHRRIDNEERRNKRPQELGVFTVSSSVELRNLFVDIEQFVLLLKYRMLLVQRKNSVNGTQSSSSKAESWFIWGQYTAMVDVVMVGGQGHITLSRSLPTTTMTSKANVLLLRGPTPSSDGDQNWYEVAFAATKYTPFPILVFKSRDDAHRLTALGDFDRIITTSTHPCETWDKVKGTGKNGRARCNTTLEAKHTSIGSLTRESHQYGPADCHTLDVYCPPTLRPDAPILVFSYGGRFYMGRTLPAPTGAINRRSRLPLVDLVSDSPAQLRMFGI